MTIKPAPDSSELLARAGSGRSVAEYAKGDVIFAQGEPAEAVFYLKKGRVKIAVVSEQGREGVVALLDADSFFGEGCLAGQTLRMGTASALEESEILRLEKAPLVRVLRDEPDFSAMFLTHILARNIRVEEDLVDHLFNSTEKRLARTLLLLANFGKEGQPEPILAKVTQETLAEMIGTTRSHVNRFMNKFRKLGMISYNGSIEVHRSLLNVVLYDPPTRNADTDKK
jgi:CRP/FNR family cyclic AMP-dependent transcriptional regulator